MLRGEANLWCMPLTRVVFIRVKVFHINVYMRSWIYTQKVYYYSEFPPICVNITDVGDDNDLAILMRCPEMRHTYTHNNQLKRTTAKKGGNWAVTSKSSRKLNWMQTTSNCASWLLFILNWIWIFSSCYEPTSTQISVVSTLVFLLHLFRFVRFDKFQSHFIELNS